MNHPNLSKWCAMALVSVLALGPAAAQTQSSPSPVASASYSNLFAHYGAFLELVREVCKSGECLSLADQGAVILKDGQGKHAKGWRVPAERRQFHRDISSSLTQIHEALVRESDAQDRLAAKRALQERVQPVDNAYNCDQVFALALGVCSLYLIASPLAAAICTGIALYGYNKCLQQAAWQAPSQWD